MDEFLVLLQAKLDEAKSKGLINSDIALLQGQLDKLKIQVELDPKAAQKLANDIGKLINQKIAISNINIDTNQAVRNAKQGGQQIGDALNQSVSSSVNNIKKNITDTLKEITSLNANDIIKKLNLNRASIGDDVVGQVRLLVSEVNNLGREAAKTNSDSAWEQLISKCSELGKVLDAFGKTRSFPGIEEVKRFADYFNGKTISVGYKSSGLSGTDLSAGKLNRELKDLGVQFSATKQEAISLDSVWEEMCNTTGRMDLLNVTTAQDQLQTIISELQKAQSILNGEQGLVPHPNAHGDVTKYLSDVERARDTVINLQNEMTTLMQKESQESTTSADQVVKNENRKQQAIQQTANVQKQISESESLIKSGANVTTFEHSNNAAREASEYFKQLLQDENAVISVSERFGQLNGLTSFTVNIKRATGEVESLRYALEEMKDTNGKGTGEFYFTNKGAELNNSNAIKYIQAVENAFADYTAKLAQFKSTNSEILNGLSTPIADFENKLSGLKNGTTTIDEVVNSFKSLNTEASNITANFSRQLSPIDSAIRNLSKGEETIAGLRAEIKGLNNAPKEINTELNKCSSLLAKVKQIESENGRTSEWSQAYKEWANSVDALKAKLTTLRKEQSNVASTQVFKIGDLKNNDIAYMSKVYNTIEKQMSEINKMANAKGWNIVDISGVEQADGKIKQITLTVKDAEGALKRLTMQREKLQGNGKAQFGLMQVGDIKVIETASQAQEKLAQSAAKANAKLSEQANKIQLSFETGGYESKVETLIARTQQWTDVNGNARISTTALSTALNNLGDASKALSNNNTVENQKALIAAEKELDTQIKKVTNSIRTMNTDLAKDSAVASLHNRVQDFIGKNGKAVKYFGAELNKILNETAQGAEVSKTKLAQLEQSFGNIGVTARNTGKLGKTWFQTLREGMNFFSYWTSSTFLVMKAIQSIKGGLGTVKALDTALVDLKKTTTMTNSELDNFYYSSNKVAKQMGVTTEEIINQASAWSRLGYGSAEAATKMAKLSSQFALISPGMDVDKATSGLVSIMKAYDISVDDVLEKIESKVNIIGNNLALSNDNIVSMLQDSVSAMAEGRNTLEQTIALESAAYEIVQDNSVGNGFKTVSLRLRGLNEETQELDDSLKTIKGDLYDLTGVSVMEDADTYKSTYQILKEISEVWNSLTDKTRAEALELMFGKLRSNVGAAVLKNFSAAERAMNLMADSAGSADRELEVVTQSLDFKLNRLSETSTSVAQNLFKRDDMKTVVDGFTSVMNVIDSLTSKLGLFGSIGLGAGLFAGWKNVGIA